MTEFPRTPVHPPVDPPVAVYSQSDKRTGKWKNYPSPSPSRPCHPRSQLLSATHRPYLSIRNFSIELSSLQQTDNGNLIEAGKIGTCVSRMNQSTGRNMGVRIMAARWSRKIPKKWKEQRSKCMLSLIFNLPQNNS